MVEPTPLEQRLADALESAINAGHDAELVANTALALAIGGLTRIIGPRRWVSSRSLRKACRRCKSSRSAAGRCTE
jgi:hypothetical protein